MNEPGRDRVSVRSEEGGMQTRRRTRKRRRRRRRRQGEGGGGKGESAGDDSRSTRSVTLR